MTLRPSEADQLYSLLTRLTLALHDEAGVARISTDTRAGSTRVIFAHATDCQQGDGFRWRHLFSLAFAAEFGWSPQLSNALGLLGGAELLDVVDTQDQLRQGAEAYVVAVVSAEAEWLAGSAELPSCVLEDVVSCTAGLTPEPYPRERWTSAIETGRQAWQNTRMRERGFVIVDRASQSLIMESTDIIGLKTNAPSRFTRRLNGFSTIMPRPSLELVLVRSSDYTLAVFQPLRGGGWVRSSTILEDRRAPTPSFGCFAFAVSLASLALLSWSPIAAATLGFAAADPAATEIQSGIIARAYIGFAEKADSQIRFVAEMAHRLCLVYGRLQTSIADWEDVVRRGWQLAKELASVDEAKVIVGNRSLALVKPSA